MTKTGPAPGGDLLPMCEPQHNTVIASALSKDRAVCMGKII